MLRNVFSGLVVAAIMAALYALGMYFGPLNWKLGDDAFDLLVLVGTMLSLMRKSTSEAGASRNTLARERSS